MSNPCLLANSKSNPPPELPPEPSLLEVEPPDPLEVFLRFPPSPILGLGLEPKVKDLLL